MKINLRQPLRQNPITLLRRAGYSPFLDPKSNQLSFVRRLGNSFYPRFHIYLNEKTTALNLHLDQKKPSYPNQKAHAGEYDSVLVEQEAKRIIQLIG